MLIVDGFADYTLYYLVTEGDVDKLVNIASTLPDRSFVYIKECLNDEFEQHEISEWLKMRGIGTMVPSKLLMDMIESRVDKEVNSV